MYFLEDSKSREKRELMPSVLPLCLASFMGVLMSVLVLVPQPEVLYITFFTMVVFRAFLYSIAVGFVSAV